LLRGCKQSVKTKRKKPAAGMAANTVFTFRLRPGPYSLGIFFYGRRHKLQALPLPEKVMLTSLRGIWVPLATPMHHGDIDFPVLQNLADGLIASGAHGLVVCGTTGEASQLVRRRSWRHLGRRAYSRRFVCAAVRPAVAGHPAAVLGAESGFAQGSAVDAGTRGRGAALAHDGRQHRVQAWQLSGAG
jgi:hypothetical protein